MAARCAVRCWYFQQGRCANDKCFFTHDFEEVAQPPVCQFWEHGDCKNGNACAYRHEGKALSVAPRRNEKPPRGARKTTAPPPDVNPFEALQEDDEL